MHLVEPLGHPDQVPSLVRVKAGGVDHLLELTLFSTGQRLRVRITGEQARSHQVDPLVGALRRQDGGRE